MVDEEAIRKAAQNKKKKPPSPRGWGIKSVNDKNTDSLTPQKIVHRGGVFRIKLKGNATGERKKRRDV